MFGDEIREGKRQWRAKKKRLALEMAYLEAVGRKYADHRASYEMDVDKLESSKLGDASLFSPLRVELNAMLEGITTDLDGNQSSSTEGGDKMEIDIVDGCLATAQHELKGCFTTPHKTQPCPKGINSTKSSPCSGDSQAMRRFFAQNQRLGALNMLSPRSSPSGKVA